MKIRKATQSDAQKIKKLFQKIGYEEDIMTTQSNYGNKGLETGIIMEVFKDFK